MSSKVQVLFSLALFCFLPFSARAQFTQKYVLGDHVINGIYLSPEQFNGNEPAIYLGDITNESLELLKSDATETQLNCVSNLMYRTNDGQVMKLPVKKIWGIVIDHQLYIRHIKPSRGTRYCFYKLLYFGTISKYFVYKSTSASWNSTPMHSYSPTTGSFSSIGSIPIYSQGKTAIAEFTVDFQSGKTFNTNRGLGKIKKTIQSDASFAKEKITKDNVDEYIVAYNEKHKHPNSAISKVLMEEDR
jgi:hypothetical protein